MTLRLLRKRPTTRRSILRWIPSNLWCSLTLLALSGTVVVAQDGRPDPLKSLRDRSPDQRLLGLDKLLQADPPGASQFDSFRQQVRPQPPISASSQPGTLQPFSTPPNAAIPNEAQPSGLQPYGFKPPAASPPIEPPVARPPIEPPAASPFIEPPAASPFIEPPVARPPIEPPAASPFIEPPIGAPVSRPAPTQTTIVAPAPSQPVATGVSSPVTPPGPEPARSPQATNSQVIRPQRTAQLPLPGSVPDPAPVPQGGRDSSSNGAWKLRGIDQIDPFSDYDAGIAPKVIQGEISLPADANMATAGGAVPQPYTGRLYPEMLFNWEASNLAYNPLYFQDVQLERYGHTHHPVLQPFASVGLFASQLVALPYQMSLHPISRREYALGYYRPGDPAPRIYYQPPLNGKAAAVQAAATVGAVFLIP